jgi:hypothetical protein
VACSVQDYVQLLYGLLDPAVSGEAIFYSICRDSGAELVLNTCAILNRLFVNIVRVKNKEMSAKNKPCDTNTGKLKVKSTTYGVHTCLQVALTVN